MRALLAECAFAAPWADLERDAALAGGEIERAWAAGAAPLSYEDLEVLQPVFYRRKGAHLVGRVRGGNRVMPVVLALVHGPEGMAVDSVLLTETGVSIVFSFTRSYFQAKVGRGPRPPLRHGLVARHTGDGGGGGAGGHLPVRRGAATPYARRSVSRARASRTAAS